MNLNQSSKSDSVADGSAGPVSSAEELVSTTDKDIDIPATGFVLGSSCRLTGFPPFKFLRSLQPRIRT